MAEIKEQRKSKRGGDRGGRRPETDRKVPLTVRISQEAKDKLDTVKNKSEWIDAAVKKYIK